MRWLFRPVATLLLAPILFEILVLYLQAQTSGAAPAWPSAGRQLVAIYAGFTLPALVLMLLILLPADLALRRAGVGLLTVAVSPLLAGLVVLAARALVSEPHVQHWASALLLFIVYGVVWGLTIRDPATVMAPYHAR